MDEKSVDRVRVSKEGTGGIESLIDTVAIIVALVGAVSAFALLFFGPVTLWLRLVSFIQIALSTAIIYVLLRGLSEIIRILKHSSGLPYGGSLSKVDDLSSFACGGCGAMVYRWPKCNQCGAKFNKGEQDIDPNA